MASLAQFFSAKDTRLSLHTANPLPKDLNVPTGQNFHQSLRSWSTDRQSQYPAAPVEPVRNGALGNHNQRIAMAALIFGHSMVRGLAGLSRRPVTYSTAISSLISLRSSRVSTTYYDFLLSLLYAGCSLCICLMSFSSSVCSPA